VTFSVVRFGPGLCTLFSTRSSAWTTH